jgi:Putative zinc dependent peptidase (DUF5700)
MRESLKSYGVPWRCRYRMHKNWYHCKMKYIFLLLFLLTTFSKAFCQKVNTGAIDKFWQVADYLKSGKPLNDSLWNSYFNLAGNKKYMDNNRDEESALEHRKYLALVFRPSLADSLINFEKNNSVFKTDIFENLLYIKQNEKKIRAYTLQIASPDYLKRCIDLAKGYLPLKKWNRIPENLTIYVQAITFDAAVQDSSMYFGITRIYEYDKYKMGLIAAHEFHHLLRVDKQITKSVSPADSAAFSIIDNINNEGCADLIDKMIALENAETIFRGRDLKKRLIDKAAIVIKKMDSCFIFLSSSPENYITERSFNRITNYSSGHLPGLYMANIIKHNGFEQELINSSDNPFNFFYVYNKAAKKSKQKPPSFSKQTLKYLRQLEKRVL